MNDYHYIPLENTELGKSYLFRVAIARRGDATWHASITSLPGCSAWGYSKEEALVRIEQAARAYIQSLLMRGMRVPADLESIDAPVVAVAI